VVLDAAAAEPIERAIPRDRHEPRSRASRHTVPRPTLERPDKRVLHTLLSQRKIPGATGERSRHAARFFAKDTCQISPDVDDGSGIHAAKSSSMLDHGPDLDRATAGPPLRHRQRRIQISDVDLGVPTDELVALQKRSVDDQRVAAAEAHGRSRLPRLQIVRCRNHAAVLLEPPPNPGVSLCEVLMRKGVKGGLILGRTAEQQHILHRSSIRRTHSTITTNAESRT
jgi:hypothetical protein